MKITILLRYHRIENSKWKRELVDRLIHDGLEVSLIFGESSYYRHLKAALKDFGPGFLKRKKQLEQAGESGEKKINVFNHYRRLIKTYPVRELNGKKCELLIKNIAPDYLLLLGTGILRKNILSLPLEKAIHCHHGHLPEFRGVSTAEWSLFEGQDVFITTHFVDPGIDSGDVLLEKKVQVKPGDRIADIRYRCRTESVGLLVETFRGLQNKTLIPRPQQGGGRQLYFMHPFFKEIVERKLQKIR